MSYRSRVCAHRSGITRAGISGLVRTQDSTVIATPGPLRLDPKRKIMVIKAGSVASDSERAERFGTSIDDFQPAVQTASSVAPATKTPPVLKRYPRIHLAALFGHKGQAAIGGSSCHHRVR